MGLLDKFCRFCAQELVPFSSKCIFDSDNSKLLNIAWLCIPGSLSTDDRYPKLACTECVAKMNVINDFQEMGSSALKTFDEILTKEENQKPGENELIQIKVEVLPDVEFEEEESKHLIKLPHENKLPTEEYPECIPQDLHVTMLETEHINSSSDNNQITKIRLECKKCKLGFSRPDFFEKHMKTHSDQMTLNCSKCQKSFMKKSALARHMLIHKQDRKLTCEICKETFIKEYDLQKHMTAHTGERRYKCEECQRGFNQKYELVRHKSSHTGEKPFKCEECGKSYREKCDLVRHMAVHKGERPHKCNQCEKSFIREDYLVQHMVHHRGEKSFQCQECKKLFVYQSSLSRHKRKMICRLNLTS